MFWGVFTLTLCKEFSKEHALVVVSTESCSKMQGNGVNACVDQMCGNLELKFVLCFKIQASTSNISAPDFVGTRRTSSGFSHRMRRASRRGQTTSPSSPCPTCPARHFGPPRRAGSTRTPSRSAGIRLTTTADRQSKITFWKLTGVTVSVRNIVKLFFHV